MQKVMKWLIVCGVLAMIGFAITKVIMHELRPRQMVSLGGTVFRADVADTPTARERGLAGRSSIGRDEAMLFVFDQDGAWPIWMKGMRFPIDIIWLDKDQKVVHVERNVYPDAEPHDSYYSPVPARYVLEVGAGQHNISVGSVARFDIAEEGL